jgi:hypothetical protein
MKASADRIKEIEAELHELKSRRQGLLAEMSEIRSAAESPELPLSKATREMLGLPEPEFPAARSFGHSLAFDRTPHQLSGEYPATSWPDIFAPTRMDWGAFPRWTLRGEFWKLNL